MSLPILDASLLPDLSVLTGIYGSLFHTAQAQSSGDDIVVLMSFLYDVLNGGKS